MDELLTAEEIEKRYYDRKEELEGIELHKTAHPDYLKKLKTELQAYETAIDSAY